MPRDVSIAYGRGHLTIRLPERARATMVRKHRLPPLPDPRGAVATALEPLASIARGKSSACILICDVTRPVPNGLFLRPMIETLHAAGVPRARVTVLVATGLHRPNLGDELEAVLGDPWVSANTTVINHDARRAEEHVDLGLTEAHAVPIHLDRRFVEAELRIATGLVEPHFMAGWSGGRKVVAPGVAGEATIRTFHSARFMEHPLAAQCNLEGNPLHEAQLEIVRRLGGVMALNTVLDDERRLVHVNFGDIIDSHLDAVAFVRAATAVAIGRRFRTVVTSSAGHPLDRTYYQTVKGMVTPLDILEPGGTLIMASECAEGMGSDEFRASQTRLLSMGAERFLESLWAKSLADIDEWQTEMQLKSMRLGRVQLYATGLSEADRELTGVEMIDDLDSAIGRAIDQAGDHDIAIIPEGPYVVPLHAPAAA